jgi:hypothetical protein
MDVTAHRTRGSEGCGFGRELEALVRRGMPHTGDRSAMCQLEDAPELSVDHFAQHERVQLVPQPAQFEEWPAIPKHQQLTRTYLNVGIVCPSKNFGTVSSTPCDLNRPTCNLRR